MSSSRSLNRYDIPNSFGANQTERFISFPTPSHFENPIHSPTSNLFSYAAAATKCSEPAKKDIIKIAESKSKTYAKENNKNYESHFPSLESNPKNSPKKTSQKNKNQVKSKQQPQYSKEYQNTHKKPYSDKNFSTKQYWDDNLTPKKQHSDENVRNKQPQLLDNLSHETQKHYEPHLLDKYDHKHHQAEIDSCQSNQPGIFTWGGLLGPCASDNNSPLYYTDPPNTTVSGATDDSNNKISYATITQIYSPKETIPKNQLEAEISLSDLKLTQTNSPTEILHVTDQQSIEKFNTRVSRAHSQEKPKKSKKQIKNNYLQSFVTAIEWTEFAQHNLCRELQNTHYVSDDVWMYLENYPGYQVDLQANKNLLFYHGALTSSPKGDYVHNIHKHWFAEYKKLELHHGYIQWLFPIKEQGLNSEAQPLMNHEIQELLQDKKFLPKFIKSYELMLNFYGMKLKNGTTGEIERSPNFTARYAHLNNSVHNFMRITRILKSLGEFNLSEFQYSFVKFILIEIFEKNQLKKALNSCINYWCMLLRDTTARKDIFLYANEYYFKMKKKNLNKL